VAETELRELYDRGHRLVVEELVEKMESGEASPDEKRLFTQLMKQNNITAAPLEGTATQAMAQMAAKLTTFGSLEEKAKVVPIRPITA
jgi:polyhydroxyalkanoate synthesis regulator phasin